MRRLREDEEASDSVDQSIRMQRTSESDREPVSLEGFLQIRMGRSSGHSSLIWRRKFVYFSFADGGSITVYNDSPNFDVRKTDETTSIYRTVYNKLSRGTVKDGMAKVDFDITPNLPWIAMDVERDSATFVVEIMTISDCTNSDEHGSTSSTSGKSSGSGTDKISENDNDAGLDSEEDEPQSVREARGLLMLSRTMESDVPTVVQANDREIVRPDTEHVRSNHDLSVELAHAKSKFKPLRIYFRCEKGSNEKALWLRAFATFGRLSSQYRRQKGFLSSITAPLHMKSIKARLRDEENAVLARDTRNLDFNDNPSCHPDVDIRSSVHLDVGRRPSLLRDREYRVAPSYAYPHRWMTLQEMREEMLLVSEHFHDVRVPSCPEKEIGSLKVEVLQCLGLPKLDRVSDTDAVVYLVCGAYSFATDVIPNRQNPMWLRKSRRACNFPIFHGYACLYVGVFDYEQKKSKDNFGGRVEINIAKLRHGSTYDVTLPLRLSKHVYSRRKRGAIRLRFTLNWTSERNALLSYLPHKFRIPLPQHTSPRSDVTVQCTDPKAFRNIAITVHGAHLPGRFTFVQMRAAIREVNFTRKYLLTTIRQSFRDLRQWKQPTLSAYVFFTWMHCIYSNRFSLVPAYTLLFFLIILMCNYTKFSIEQSIQRGFIPPSWEELFDALIRGHRNGYRAVQPLELMPRKPSMTKKRSSKVAFDKLEEYQVSTYMPKGRRLMTFLGLIPTKPMCADDHHLEFPFASGIEYPKFTIKECLVHRNGDAEAINVSLGSPTPTKTINDVRSRLPLDIDLHEMRRKDTSGTKDYDEEEMNFNAAKVVLAKGKRAKKKISKTASAFGNKTGLNSYIVNPLQTRIEVSVSHVNYISNHIAHSTRNIVGGNTTSTNSSTRASTLDDNHRADVHFSDAFRPRCYSDGAVHDNFIPEVPNAFSSDTDGDSHVGQSVEASFDEDVCEFENVDPALMFPQQDIDVEGQNNGKKLTDDLAEIKDKMHELTWHLFDDYTYVLKHKNTVFFGDGKKSEKKRNSDIKKQLDKYLGVGKYSHKNPFVARVGMYVEPIIGSSYSFLCFFRAGFNIFTWQDPMMTFWVSFFTGILVLVLFIFPWRLFLFTVGFLMVGPQNWLIRILRERGHLPPAPQYKQVAKLPLDEIHECPTHAPIFTIEDRKPGNEQRRIQPTLADPREIHNVVVPYTPLMYQRCYDWPPEVDYALVRKEVTNIEEKKKIIGKENTKIRFLDNYKWGEHQKLGLRNRFYRRQHQSISNAPSSSLDRGHTSNMSVSTFQRVRSQPPMTRVSTHKRSSSVDDISFLS